MAVLVIDHDSIVYDLMAAVARVTGRTDITYELAEWDGMADLVGGQRELFRIFEECFSLEAMIAGTNGGLLLGAGPALQSFKADGDELHIATHRQKRFTDAIAGFYAHHRIAVDSITLTADKLAVCRAVSADVLIDDKPTTIAAAHAAGQPVLSLHHAYCRAALAEAGAPVCTDWAAIRAVVRARWPVIESAAARR